GDTLKFRIVGYDEIFGRKDYISIDSPMARALLKKEVGDLAVVISCGLTSEIPLARASISTLFIVPRGLKMASCILTIRWWMGWKR
ncbi:GreA/GreB family elongation factor, partial [Salmonella enterica subsp. enterica serovar Kentucky]|nr:GreA/GreB family elongation factor [Salmonella enterica subsp. enterica serovar Kentucky]